MRNRRPQRDRRIVADHDVRAPKRDPDQLPQLLRDPSASRTRGTHIDRIGPLTAEHVTNGADDDVRRIVRAERRSVRTGPLRLAHVLAVSRQCRYGRGAAGIDAYTDHAIRRSPLRRSLRPGGSGWGTIVLHSPITMRTSRRDRAGCGVRRCCGGALRARGGREGRERDRMRATRGPGWAGGSVPATATSHPAPTPIQIPTNASPPYSSWRRRSSSECRSCGAIEPSTRGPRAPVTRGSPAARPRSVV